MNTIYLHPKNPQPRLLEQIKQALQNEQIVAYPTEIGYMLLTHISAKDALAKVSKIPAVKQKDQYVIVCRNISNASAHADINDEQFRIIKNSSQGNQFILPSSKQTPKYLINPKNKNIGIHITAYEPLLALLELLDDTVVIHELDNETIEVSSPYDIEDLPDGQIDVLVNVDVINTIDHEVLDLSDL